MSHDKESEPRHTNRLINEKSPYLLQHAHNPVDWYAWGEEAFARARSEDKPVLLSIGYATCHWCHVMERESFEDEATAKILNDKFIAIKVDREERPDVDQIYMRALHATGQHGGWPLNMFLTPERLPITGGTYFPPQPAYGRPSFAQVLDSIHNLWTSDRSKINQSATALHEFLRQDADPERSEQDLADTSCLTRALEQYESAFDRHRGGFLSNGPNKFPPSMALIWLIRYHRETGESRALEIVETTLDHMKRGGIYDQVGGGLSRYATDHDWLVPHFEKMLYDNALFVRALIECYQATQNERYRLWAEDVLEYVVRDMTSPEGPFYSAEDADSEGEEGKFYVWTATEFEQCLSKAGISDKDIHRLMLFWGLTARGNFEGKNILNETLPRDQFLKAHDLSASDWQGVVDQARSALLEQRSNRIRPLLDDKVLTGWNALMISSFAMAGRVFSVDRWTQVASRAAGFIQNTLRDENGKLLRRYRDGDARYPAGLSDHALLGMAFLDLYRATFDARHVATASELARAMVDGFYDEASGAFFETRADAKDLIVRAIETYDGVEPSGTSSAVRLLDSLARLGIDTSKYRTITEKLLRYYSPNLLEQPTAHPWLLLTLQTMHHPPLEVAIVHSDSGSSQWEEVESILNFEARREHAVAVAATEEIAEAADSIPLLAGRTLADGKPLTIYVCQNFACQLPVHDANGLRSNLN